MKNLLLTCCLLAAALSQATAQISISDFNTNINELNAAIAKKDSLGQRHALDRLNSMVSLEIRYRTSNMTTIPMQGRQDSIAAEKAWMKANDDLNKAIAEPYGTTAQSKAKKSKDLQDAQNERAAAQAELKKASGERQMFINNRNNLETELKIRRDFLPLVSANIPANQSSINDDLKQFAATLQ
jgi:hypothetical protein